MASAVDIHHSARRRSNKESREPLDQQVSCNASEDRPALHLANKVGA
jgi:hypothetical protein